MSALSEVQRLLDELVDTLERAKGEAPDVAVDAVTFMRAETKVLRRRIENIVKAIGDTGTEEVA